MSSNKYRIPELRSSLCGCSLETGSKIIGWVYLVLGALTVLLAIIINVGLVAITNSKDFKETESEKQNIWSIFLVGFGVITWFMAFFGILQVLINLLLLKGIYEKKSTYIWPWCICQIVSEVFNIIFELFFDYKLNMDQTESGNIVMDIIVEIFFFILSIYCIWIVFSYYRQLKRQNDDLPAYETHVYPV